MADLDWFSTDVAIRRNADGLIRVYRSNHSLPGDDGSFSDYIWAEGNFACDCNRDDFFRQAGGEEPFEDNECGDTAYSIVSIKDDSGKLLYSETEG